MIYELANELIYEYYTGERKATQGKNENLCGLLLFMLILPVEEDK